MIVCQRLRVIKKTIVGYLFPHNESCKQTHESITKFILTKNFLSAVGKILYNASSYWSETTSWQSAKAYREENPEELNTDFVDAILPYLEKTIFLSWFALLAMILAYCKYPQVARWFWTWEVLVNIQEGFLSRAAYEYHVKYVYTMFFFNWFCFTGSNFALNFACASLFFVAFPFGQSLVFKLPTRVIIYSNVVPTLFTMLAMVLFQCVIGKFYQLKEKMQKLSDGHLQFVDNFEEGLVIVPEDLCEVTLINHAAAEILQVKSQDGESNTARKADISQLKSVELNRLAREHKVTGALELVNRDEDKTESTLYDIMVASLAKNRQRQQSEDFENIYAVRENCVFESFGNHGEPAEVKYIKVVVKKMTYFEEPAIQMNLRDVSKKIRVNDLERKNEKKKWELQSSKLSNERVAHEMRTPLSSIILTICYLLNMEHTAENLKKAKGFYRQIGFQAELLLHSVNDRLDLRLIEKGRFEAKICSFDPNETFEKILQMFQQQAFVQKIEVIHLVKHELNPPSDGTNSQVSARRSKFTVFSARQRFYDINGERELKLPFLKGDRVRLMQVLISIVKNALKFTRSGFIVISTSYNYAEQKLYVHVKDTGIGISQERQTDLLACQENFGMGLRICKAIVEQNGGGIEIKSDGLNRGTRVIFTMAMGTVSQDDLCEQDLENQQIDLAHGEVGTRNPMMESSRGNLLGELDMQVDPADFQQNQGRESEVRLIPNQSTSQVDRAGDRHAHVDQRQENSEGSPNPRDQLQDQEERDAISENGINLSFASPIGEDLECDAQVLIVDDHFMNILGLQAQLSSFDIKNNFAMNGKEALKKVSERLESIKAGKASLMFKLILISFSMPDMNGPETAEAILELLSKDDQDDGIQKPKPFICCLTANQEKKYYERAISAGMDMFCTKPILIEDLEKILKRLSLV